jgi:hypothetical protein
VGKGNMLDYGKAETGAPAVSASGFVDAVKPLKEA